MPPRSPEPLRRVTLNLFDRDCDAMERRYGHGWSERVREMVRQHLKPKHILVEHDDILQFEDEIDD
jgi:hypothetical protein